MKAITALTLRAAEQLKFQVERCTIDQHIAEPINDDDADERVLVSAEGAFIARCTADPRWTLVFNWKAEAKEPSNAYQRLGVYDYTVAHCELSDEERFTSLTGVHIWGECEEISGALESAVAALGDSWKSRVCEALSESDPVFTEWDNDWEESDIPWMQDI